MAPEIRFVMESAARQPDVPAPEGLAGTYRFGYGLGVLEQGKVNFELGVDAQRRESATAGGASNGLLGRATLGW